MTNLFSFSLFKLFLNVFEFISVNRGMDATEYLLDKRSELLIIIEDISNNIKVTKKINFFLFDNKKIKKEK